MDAVLLHPIHCAAASSSPARRPAVRVPTLLLQSHPFVPTRQVLGLDQEADEAAIKRAKRTLSLATHPDKIGAAPGAADAFNLVTEVGWGSGGRLGGAGVDVGWGGGGGGAEEQGLCTAG